MPRAVERPRPVPQPPLPPVRCAGCGEPVGILPTFAGGRYFCDRPCLERFRDAIASAAARSEAFPL
jgi:hypothetical protein